MPEKYLVVGLGMAGWGNSAIRSVSPGQETSISAATRSQRFQTNCLRIAPRVGIVANMQANVVTDIIINKLK